MSAVRVLTLFVLAALAEIGGAWLIWQGAREHRGVVWIGAGVVTLGAYGFIITLQDEHYPTLLREIDCPPPLLFARGLSRVLKMPQIAVVGSRNCSMSGREVAAMFSRQLGSAGLSICSGLASGIDTAAHTASVSANLPTVAVLGNGIDSIYPSRNAKLAAQIGDCGVLVSEFPRGSPPRPEHFPRRNRIIAGLARGTLVAEARQTGGALITAWMALEQNREVFAAPAALFAPTGEGTNQLIRKGYATLVTSVDELLAELEGQLGAPATLPPADGAPEPEAVALDLNAPERTLYDALTAEPVHLDALCERTGLDSSNALVYLLSLEFKGLVRQLAGKQFFRA